MQRFTKPVGLCRYTANLFNDLRSVPELQVTLVLGAWQKDYYRSALQVDVEDSRILWISLNRPSLDRYRWCLWDLPKLARSLHVDVVHLLHQLPVLKALFPCPIVLTIHDLYAYDSPGAIGFPNVYVNRLVIRMAIGASTEVVSISQFTKERLLRWFPGLAKRMKLPVIYQSVRLTAPLAPEQPISSPFLLCVAQHRAHKNLDLVIEGHALAVSRGIVPQGTPLILVGSEGPQTTQLTEAASRSKGVVFLDTISDAHLAYLYRSCELYICASSIEGFCLPLVEAMLSGCRIVCSDIPVLREVAGGNATYFSLEGRPVIALAEAIKTALSVEPRPADSPVLTQKAGERWLDLYETVAGQSAQQKNMS